MNPGFRLFARITRPLRRLADVTVLYHMDLRADIAEMPAPPGIEIGPGSREEVEAAAQLSAPGFRESFLRRLDEGLVCFVARAEGGVVGYDWTMYGSGEDEGDVIELGPGEIYTLDAFTQESWRGRGVHVALLAHMLRAARELGYTDAFTMASVLKRLSHRNLRRLGWTETGRALRIRRPGGRFRILALRGSRRPLA